MDLAPKYKFSIAACARWETKNISEWIAYHRAIGFEHIYLYCNDNDPAELYECLLPLLGEESWPGESGQGDEWIFCLTVARMPRIRREHDQTNTGRVVKCVEILGGVISG